MNIEEVRALRRGDILIGEDDLAITHSIISEIPVPNFNDYICITDCINWKKDDLTSSNRYDKMLMISYTFDEVMKHYRLPTDKEKKLITLKLIK